MYVYISVCILYVYFCLCKISSTTEMYEPHAQKIDKYNHRQKKAMATSIINVSTKSKVI